MPPAIFTLYRNNRFQILYHLVRNTYIQILNIGYASEIIKPRG